MPVDIETRIQELQKRMGERARTRYGYQHAISHGNSRPHITLMEPVEDPPERIHRAVQAVAREYGPFRVSFSGIGLFPSHTIYLSCEEGVERLTRIRESIFSQMGLTASKKTFHVSVARHIPQKDFPCLVATAEEESLAFHSLTEATLVAHGIFIFTKNKERESWFPYSYYGLTGPVDTPSP